MITLSKPLSKSAMWKANAASDEGTFRAMALTSLR